MEAASRFGDVKNESGKYLVVFDLINSEKILEFFPFHCVRRAVKRFRGFFFCVCVCACVCTVSF